MAGWLFAFKKKKIFFTRHKQTGTGSYPLAAVLVDTECPDTSLFNIQSLVRVMNNFPGRFYHIKSLLEQSAIDVLPIYGHIQNSPVSLFLII